ncbi:transposase [Ensifer sp. 4252]
MLLGQQRVRTTGSGCAAEKAEGVEPRRSGSGETPIVINALHGHLAEYGHVVAQGPAHVAKLIDQIEDRESDLPDAARLTLSVSVDTLRLLEDRIGLLDEEITRRAREDEDVRRLQTIPDVGPITATALTALAPNAAAFAKGRDFAAWLGLTPLQRSTGGGQKLGATSKMGERTLRRLLIIGASAVVRHAARR